MCNVNDHPNGFEKAEGSVAKKILIQTVCRTIMNVQQVLHKAHVTRWQAFKEQKPDAGQWFVARLSSGEFIPVLIWGEPLAYWFDEDDLWFPVPAIG